ncbi:MAG TPA: hypothetical protein VIQ01_09875 [Burkholderiales bacterium]
MHKYPAQTGAMIVSGRTGNKAGFRPGRAAMMQVDAARVGATMRMSFVRVAQIEANA